ncbi:hypothetical protein NSQ20_12055 [Paenibacillus sp. FSL K6-1122]|uniref:hypothetical protein n=1 Tax=Paenibacillus sp. FSL K6-1122 TaxID=2954512 RepID=UPI0030EBACA3
MSVYSEMETLRKEIEEKTRKLQEMEQENFDVDGVWEFTTELDCEGRRSRRLGRYEGNLYDGIKLYGSQCYYSLRCKRVGFLSIKNSKPRKKSVCFNIEDNSIKPSDKKDQLEKLKVSVPVGHTLKESNQYGCITLEWEA